MHGTSLPGSTMWWELDISAARPLIESLQEGTPIPPELADTLVASIRVGDVGELAVGLVGPFGGRERMLGRSLAAFWPAESQGVLAELIVGVLNDRPHHAPRSREIASLILRDACLTVAMKGGSASDMVQVAVGGVVHDDRSRWSLRASEERYRRLIHHLPIPLLQADATDLLKIYDRLKSEGVTDLGAYLDSHPELIQSWRAPHVVRVTDANRSAVQLFGAERPEDFLNRVDDLLIISPEARRRGMIAHFDGRRSRTELIRLRTLDNRLLDIRYTVTFPTRPERLDVTLMAFEDVTERLRTEIQLRQFQADYTRAARIATLGELATSIAHEVSQPLSAIVTNAETSLRWLGRDDPNLAKVEQLTRRIAESAHRAHEIVQRIRAMAVRHAPERIPLDVNEVIDEALLFTRHDLESRSIDLSVTLAAGLPPVVGDRVQLQQVIVNLVLNGIQAIAQCDGAKGRIELRTDAAADDTLLVQVRDNGPGIPAENLDRIFEGFFTTKEDGMGIGLAICQSIIAAHGGSIAAANHPEGGAKFEIRLPAATSLPLC